jgi:hypothetical protein
MYAFNCNGKPQECRFVKSDGRRCHAMAVRNMAYCYHHLPAHRRPSAKGRPEKAIRVEFVIGDESQSRKKAVEQLKAAMEEGRLDHLRGELCLYGMRILATETRARLGTHSRPFLDARRPAMVSSTQPDRRLPDSIRRTAKTPAPLEESPY